MDKAKKIQQKRLGERLSALRHEHEFSQEDLAKHIGVSRQAIGQIEKGERAVDAVELQQFATLFEMSVEQLLNAPPSTAVRAKFSKHASSAAQFDAEKFRHVLLYVLATCGGKPNIGETVLYKLLYFIDFNAYEVLHAPVMGLPYIKMPFGPVPVQTVYRKAVKRMVERQELKIFIQEYYGKVQKRYVALVDPDISRLSSLEKQLIDKVIQQLSDFSAKKITEYAHGDAPWMLAEDGMSIRYADVIERATPYAQVDQWAKWQAAGAADVAKHLHPLTKEERDYYESLRP